MAERMHDAHHIEHMRKKREGQKRRKRHQEEERKKREKEAEKKKKERDEQKHSGHAHEKKSSHSASSASQRKVREHAYVICVSSPAISALAHRNCRLSPESEKLQNKLYSLLESESRRTRTGIFSWLA